MNSDSILLSRYKLQNWLACQRRFQLQYVVRETWPSVPVHAGLADAFSKGEQFHKLMEQVYMGLDVDPPPDSPADILSWWRNFKAHPPQIPAGTYHPEMSISVPVGSHFLFGRYDLIVLNDTSAHIVDWKTERKPRSAETLAADWQTRLYLAMLTEGSHALGRIYAPEQVAITYWFAQHPEQSVTIGYDTAQHTRNWAELTAAVDRIDSRLQMWDAIWPLTDDWSTCERCRYQRFCGRGEERPHIEPEETMEEIIPPIFEPDLGN